MILNVVLLYKTDINGTDGVPSYCTIYQFSSDRQTRKSESPGSLDLYFFFIFVTAENAVSHM